MLKNKSFIIILCFLLSISMGFRISSTNEKGPSKKKGNVAKVELTRLQFKSLKKTRRYLIKINKRVNKLPVSDSAILVPKIDVLLSEFNISFNERLEPGNIDFNEILRLERITFLIKNESGFWRKKKTYNWSDKNGLGRKSVKYYYEQVDSLTNNLVIPTSIGVLNGVECKNCNPNPPNEEPENDVKPIELSIKNIPCVENESVPCQFSSLAWHNDELILMPQYPNFPEKGKIEKNKELTGEAYKIKKDEIKRYIKHKQNSVKAYPIKINNSIINKDDKTHQGYEAIVLKGNSIFALIEFDRGKSVLILGSIESDNINFTNVLDTFQTATIIDDMAKEALVNYKDSLILAFDEANCWDSKNIVHTYHIHDKSIYTIDLDSIHYRITDATSIENDKFWISNFLYKSDSSLINSCCFSYSNIERLVELEFKPDSHRIEVIRTKTIAKGHDHPRNWEGIARFEDQGLLLINDDYPGESTVLRFIPFE